MIALRGLWLGALRGPWPVLPMKTRALDPSPKVRGLWPVLLVETRALWGLWPVLRGPWPVLPMRARALDPSHLLKLHSAILLHH